MSRLIENFREVMGKSKLGEETTYVPTYSTGIDVLDYRNGKIDSYGHLSVGVNAGRVVQFIGKSGTGKSAMAMQAATTIAMSNPDSMVIHYDVERATSDTRVMALAGWSQEEYDENYIHMQKGLNSEHFFKLVKAHAKLKLDNFEELKIDTGVNDRRTKKRVFVLPPTIILLDSLALLSPDRIESEEEMSGQMSATAIAKANSQIFKRIAGSLEDANIILIIINHITTKIDINPMAKSAADLNFLKQDETLPGGKTPVYLTDTLVKLISSKKLKPEEDYGIKGFKVTAELIKSRSAAAGQTCMMIYDQVNGFDNVLSNLELVRDMKLLKGSPRAYFIESCESVKFTLKTFKDKYNEYPELREAFDAYVKAILLETIPTPESSKSNPVIGLDEPEEEDELTWSKKHDCYVDAEGNKYDEEGNPLD